MNDIWKSLQPTMAYPFEDHEDAPAIPDLQAGLNLCHQMDRRAGQREPQLYQKPM